MKLKKILTSPIFALSTICLIVALLLSSVNSFTAPRIAEQEAKKAEEAKQKVLPKGEAFTDVPLTDGMPSAIKSIYRAGNGEGYVFHMVVAGYKAGLQIMCGVDADGRITGATYIASNETLDAEVGLGDRFVGHDKGSMTPEIVSGPTAKLTTSAYYRAIEAALEAFDMIEKEGGAK